MQGKGGATLVLEKPRWHRRGRALVALGLMACLLLGWGHSATAQPKPAGEMRWALYVTFPPAWLDPGEVAVGGQTLFWILYALHDALIKPMPGNLMTPSLAESWTVSDDQRVYEFKLREGIKFHNGDPFTAEDVKFTFRRYKSPILHEKVREVEIVDPSRVRFHLHQPWPDFLAYYGTLATGAAWIVPKKYLEQVGDDVFKQRPVGLGPYKF
jgi:peptide/nickel transport system substrate-binding protein